MSAYVCTNVTKIAVKVIAGDLENVLTLRCCLFSIPLTATFCTYVHTYDNHILCIGWIFIKYVDLMIRTLFCIYNGN